MWCQQSLRIHLRQRLLLKATLARPTETLNSGGHDFTPRGIQRGDRPQHNAAPNTTSLNSEARLDIDCALRSTTTPDEPKDDDLKRATENYRATVHANGIDHTSLDINSSPSELVTTACSDIETIRSDISESVTEADRTHALRRSRNKGEKLSSIEHASQSVRKNGKDSNVTRRKLRLQDSQPRRDEPLELTSKTCAPQKYQYTITRDTIAAMVNTLRVLRKQGLPDTSAHPSAAVYRASHKQMTITDRVKPSQSEKLKKSFMQRQASKEYQEYLKVRNELPINQQSIKQKIKSLLRNNDVLVLVSQTGSGKTTQLPQLILEDQIQSGVGASCNIICTQPRRLAATSVARRVANEQASRLGELVGYQVRFANVKPPQLGSINYWTAGILLKMLQEDPDAILTKYHTLIIDEVHERSLVTDLLLAILRDLVRARSLVNLPSPKIVLMSATIDAMDFYAYFAESFDDRRLKVASIEIPGRNYEVESHMLDDIVPQLAQYSDDRAAMAMLRASMHTLAAEDTFTGEWDATQRADLTDDKYLVDSVDGGSTAPKSEDLYFNDVRIPENLIALTIAHALKTSDSGDVLVFLPGMSAIDRIQHILEQQTVLKLNFKDISKFRIFRLHASLYETNDAVFEPIPEGCRRIILATNIAQTSITLPDVVHVVDSGVQRQMSYHSVRRYNEFRAVWIDRAASLQRRGRAGRTRPGQYWAMFTEARFKSLAETTTPEIKLADLATAVLVVKARTKNESVKGFMTRMLDRPAAASIDAAIEQLRKLRMLTSDEKITPLGDFAANLPLPPAMGRGLLLATLFRCLQPLLIVAAHNPDKPLINDPGSVKAQMHANLRFAGLNDDDRFSFIEAFLQYNTAVSEQAVDVIRSLQVEFVRPDAYRDMMSVAAQVYSLMGEYGVVPSVSGSANVFESIPPLLDQYSTSRSFVKAIALTMMPSNLAVWREDLESWYAQGTEVFLRPFSVNSKDGLKSCGREHPRQHGELMAYSYMLNLPANPRPMLVETSSITPLMAMLFGGPIQLVDENVIQIGGWLRYEISTDGGQRTEGGGVAPELCRPASVIIEFRKALDRYLALAFSDLSNLRYGVSDQDCLATKRRHRRANQMFIKRNSISDIFAAGLSTVLDLDVRHWDESTHLSEQVAEETRRNRQRKASPDVEVKSRLRDIHAS